MTRTAERGRLARVAGVPGAVLMGLGSILGTGFFVSVGIAAGVAGPSVILAVAVPAVVATFNGLSQTSYSMQPPNKPMHLTALRAAGDRRRVRRTTIG